MPRSGLTIFILGSVALAAMVEVHAQASGDLAQCAQLEDADARLACYDEITGKSIEKEPTGTAPPAEPMPLTQDVGEEQLAGDSKSKREPAVFHGRVTECKKDSTNKLYFYFDNGQVWKQRSDARASFRECDFPVTITKDVFGYKMQIEGDGKKIRVGRIR